MTHYLVDRFEYTHTGPGCPDTHTVDAYQSIVETTPGGPCRTPVAVRFAGVTTWVACGGLLHPDRQCRACRVVVTVRFTTVTDLGFEQSTQTSQPTGYLPQPCPGCGGRVAAVLVDAGRHILCPPPGGRV